jgi:hypothetical protein
MNMELFYFILGILFASYIAPLLDGVGALFLGWVEVRKAKMSEIISMIEIKVRKAADEEPPRRQIGFCISDEEIYPEEENDDEV